MRAEHLVGLRSRTFAAPDEEQALGYSLGIDLGTTSCAAAVLRDDHVEVIHVGTRAPGIPSMVYVREGEVLVGEAAARRLSTEPERVARHVKRRLGDPTPIVLDGQPWSASALLGRLLRSVFDTVVAREGGPPDRTVVTHPASWGNFKRDLLLETLRTAGLADAELLTEPEAAAIHYASLERVEVGSTVAVYDLGGGTFDAAVLRKTDAGFEIVGQPEGLERVGGIDFDEAVFAHVMATVRDRVEALDLDDAGVVAGLAALRLECTAAKEALSGDTDVTVPVRLPGVHADVRLTRGELEAMIRPSLAATVESLGRAVRSAGLEPAAVDRVLLVGGSSRIPLVAEVASAALGRPVAVDADPKYPVALGAARRAGTAADERDGATSATGDPAPADAATRSPGSTTRSPLTRRALPMAAAGLVIVLLGGALLLRPGPTAAGGEIFLEPAAATGADAFMPSAAVDQPLVALPPAPPGSTPATAVGALVAVSTQAGGEPGLYGGTRDQSSCDVGAIGRFLASNPEPAAAWAGALGVATADIARYLRDLTPVVLRADTRVTNHGFSNGRATPFQAVLQAGTAVLVDRHGVPRVRCACGNPLLPPQPAAVAPVYRNAPWTGFDPAANRVVQPSGEPIDVFVIARLDDGRAFERRAGTTGDADTDSAVVLPVRSGAGGPTATPGTGPRGTAPVTAPPNAPDPDRDAACAKAAEIQPKVEPVARVRAAADALVALAALEDVTADERVALLEIADFQQAVLERYTNPGNATPGAAAPGQPATAGALEAPAKASMDAAISITARVCRVSPVTLSGITPHPLRTELSCALRPTGEIGSLEHGVIGDAPPFTTVSIEPVSGGTVTYPPSLPPVVADARGLWRFSFDYAAPSAEPFVMRVRNGDVESLVDVTCHR